MEGEDFSGGIVEYDERAVLDVLFTKPGEFFGEDGMGFALQVGVDTQTSRFIVVASEVRDGIGNTPVGEKDGLRFGARDEVLVVVKLRLQAIKNPVASDESVLRIAMRVETGRGLGQSGEKG